jgi:ankyrin repeat protein
MTVSNLSIFNEASQPVPQSFMNAVVCEDEALVRALLHHSKVDLEQEIFDGLTPIFIAIQSGNETIFRLLLSTGNLNIRQKKYSTGATLLHYAAKQGKLSFITPLLSTEEIDYNWATNDGATPLFVAAQYGFEPIVRAFLDKKAIDVNKAMHDGVTPLFIAVYNGHHSVVSALLEREEIDVNHIVPKYGSALFYAVKKGNALLVKLLLADGRADPNHILETPFLRAVHEGHGAVVTEFLMDGRVDPGQILSNGGTLLQMAALQGDFDVISAFLIHEKSEVAPNWVFDPSQNDYQEFLQVFLSDEQMRESYLKMLIESPEVMSDYLVNNMVFLTELSMYSNELWECLQDPKFLNISDDSYRNLLDCILDSDVSNEKMMHPLGLLFIPYTLEQIQAYVDLNYPALNTLR